MKNLLSSVLALPRAHVLAWRKDLEHEADTAKVQEWLDHANIATTRRRS